MRTVHVSFILLTMTTAAFAQPSGSLSHESTAPGLNGKTTESCKPDLQKLCDAANLKQECLVLHWTKISSDCQDALARPMRSGGDGG
jgi:hypothetical protein